MNEVVDKIKNSNLNTNILEQKILVHDFFFNNDDPTATINIYNNGLRILDISGAGVPINSVEEIILYHYYHYYLPLLDKNPLVKLPKEWTDRYSDLGLFTKSQEFKKQRIKALLSKIRNHSSLESGDKNLNLWQDLAKEFPHCVYIGSAYRAVLIGPDDLSLDLLSSPGYSWALTLDGVKDFITNGDVYSLEDDYGFHLAKADIRGISIFHIYKLIKEEFPEVESEMAMEEEEIISFEVISIHKTVYAKSYKTIPSVD